MKKAVEGRGHAEGLCLHLAIVTEGAQFCSQEARSLSTSKAKGQVDAEAPFGHP